MAFNKACARALRVASEMDTKVLHQTRLLLVRPPGSGLKHFGGMVIFWVQCDNLGRSTLEFCLLETASIMGVASL